MSALSALASYDVSDEEDVAVEEDVAEEKKAPDADSPIVPENSEDTKESHVSPAQSPERPKDEAEEVNKFDEEDIWRDPDEENVDEKSNPDLEKQVENSDSDRKDRDESVNIEDLSGIHDDSDREQSDEESPGSAADNEDDKLGGLVDAMKVTKRRNKRRSSENATNLAKKLRTTSVDEVAIPAEPEGRCSTALQDKIKRFMERKVQDGEDLNRAIQSRKDFRNPSIYEKLIVYLGIEELGTNFPKEDYNPKTWRKAPAYDELARAQREDMAKRERERKTKVEFVTGTAKKPAAVSAAAAASDAAKKSKWDQQSLGKGGGQDKAAGHKGTVIPAVGSIKKAKV